MIKKVFIFSLFLLPLLAVACAPGGEAAVTPIIETVVYYDVYEVELTTEVTRELEVTRLIEVTVVVTGTPASAAAGATASATMVPTNTPTSGATVTAETETPTVETTAAAGETTTPEFSPTPSSETAATATVPPNAVTARETQPLHIEASVDAPAAGLVKQDEPIVVIARTQDSNWLYVLSINSNLHGFVTPSIIGLTPEQASQRFPVLTR